MEVGGPLAGVKEWSEIGEVRGGGGFRTTRSPPGYTPAFIASSYILGQHNTSVQYTSSFKHCRQLQTGRVKKLFWVCLSASVLVF